MKSTKVAFVARCTSSALRKGHEFEASVLGTCVSQEPTALALPRFVLGEAATERSKISRFLSVPKLTIDGKN